MTIWTNKSLSEALGISVNSSFKEGNDVQFNSQDVKAGDIFIALKIVGDGHDYVGDALARGASIAIVERKVKNHPADKTLIVPSTFAALRAMAEYKRNNSKATFIAVTGSVGKTSTKEALGAMLSNFGESFISRGNFNNELGVDINLSSMPDDIKYTVLEVGMNNPGEIRGIIHRIKPDIALINNVLPTHLGNFTSVEAIADAKLEILEGLKKDGTAVFNADNEFYKYCCDKARELGIKKIFSFGKSEFSDSKLISYDFDGESANSVISIDGREYSLKTSVGGEHRILNFAAVLLIGKILGIDILAACKYFGTLSEPKGRGKISKITYNSKECSIIDDSYNASPVAVQKSLQHLADMKHDHKVIILGDMREMGQSEIEYHKGLLPFIMKAGVDRVHIVGVLMKELYKILPENIKGKSYNDYKELEADLNNIIDREMMLLLKASKSIKLWAIVDKLLGIK